MGLNRLQDSTPGEASVALSHLCELYWQPLYAYLRGRGYGADEAMDLVQSFFVHLLESGALGRVDPSKGRFRSFLVASIKNFVAKHHRHEGAKKRAPALRITSLDAETAERRYVDFARDEVTPEVQFERNWAIALIERSVERLREEECEAGRDRAFEELSDHVLGAVKRPPYREVAENLGLSVAATKVRASRLRKRLGVLLCREVRATVAEEEEVASEVRHLLELWGAARA
jgi:RNA polymerase sigma-70 factor (ECF subfamily)